jgi:hypothetical protein
MTCEEFKRALDGRESRAVSLTAGQREHAEACPSCAWALKLEAELLAAPRWAEEVRMSAESRARVLAKAKVGRLFFGQHAARLFEDSAFSALITMIIAGALVYALPGLLKRALPPGAVQAVEPYLDPLIGLAKEVAAAFAPLTAQAWGAGLLAASVFALVFAAVLSVKVLVPRLQS